MSFKHLFFFIPPVRTYVQLDTRKHVNSDRNKYENFDFVWIVSMTGSQCYFCHFFMMYYAHIRRSVRTQYTKRKRKRDKGGDPNSWLFIVFDLYTQERHEWKKNKNQKIYVWKQMELALNRKPRLLFSLFMKNATNIKSTGRPIIIFYIFIIPFYFIFIIRSKYVLRFHFLFGSFLQFDCQLGIRLGLWFCQK